MLRAAGNEERCLNTAPPTIKINMHCPNCHSPGQSPGTKCTRCGWNIPAQDPQGPDLDTDLDARPILPEGEYLSPGDIFADRYEVVRELGRGGMGVVYLVRDLMLRGKEFALKIVLPELLLHSEAVDRFVNEVLSALSLGEGPNIVRVYHYGESEGLHYFTMEFLPGVSLRRLIEDRNRQGSFFSLEEVCKVLDPCLKALSYAHGRRNPVIHRDFSPENVMVRGDFPNIRVKVLDFGLAMVMSPTQFTTNARAMGKAYYMSEEQLYQPKEVDARSDLFSVGAVLYELLTGKVPMGRFLLPSEIIKDLPVEVDKVVDRAMQTDPSARYQSASEMSEAFEGVLQEYGQKSGEGIAWKRKTDSPSVAFPTLCGNGIEDPAAQEIEQALGILRKLKKMKGR